MHKPCIESTVLKKEGGGSGEKIKLNLNLNFKA